MTHTSFARRLMLGIMLGLIALVGLCYLAGFVRYQRNVSYMDTVAASLGLTRADRIREPYRVCYDLGNRCEVVGHYRTPLTADEVFARLEQDGMVIRSPSAYGSRTILMELAHAEINRLTIDSAPFTGQELNGIWGSARVATRSPNPDVEVTVSTGGPDLPHFTFDGVPIPDRILVLKVFEYDIP